MTDVDLKLKDAGILDEAVFSDLAGRDFIQALTESVAKETGLDIVLVGRLTRDKKHISTISHYKDGAEVEGVTYALSGTPCENVIKSGYCIYPQNVANLFPDDALLIEDNIQGYTGYPLKSKSGEPIGLFAGLSHDGIRYNDSLVSYVHLATTRIASELEEVIKQEELEQALIEEERANQTKTMFLANAAHEVREPLEAIIGFSALMRTTKLSIKEMQSYASEINTMAQEMLDQLNDLSSISSFEISSGNLDKTPYDIVALLKSGKDALVETAYEKGITIKPVDAEEPIIVLGDVLVTKRALLNIMSNSLKYMGRGTIKVSVNRNKDGSAVITIKDDGIGMSEKTLAKAVRAIEDFGKSYKAHYDGAGLGIPLSMLMLSKQGVKFEMESEEDKGTIVRFIFPSCLVLPEEENSFI
jgi:signal transduction histidine kinase